MKIQESFHKAPGPWRMTLDIGRGKSRLQKLKPQVHSVGTVIAHRVFVGLQPVFLKNVESYKRVLDQTTVAHSEHQWSQTAGKKEEVSPFLWQVSVKHLEALKNILFLSTKYEKIKWVSLQCTQIIPFVNCYSSALYAQDLMPTIHQGINVQDYRASKNTKLIWRGLRDWSNYICNETVHLGWAWMRVHWLPRQPGDRS